MTENYNRASMQGYVYHALANLCISIDLVLINAGASLNALSINETLGLFTAPVVRRVDSAIHWINYYQKDSAIGFGNTYPLDSDLSGG